MKKLLLLTLSLTCLATLGLADSARACISIVDQKKFRVVNQPGVRDPLEATEGDLVQLTLDVPLTPEFIDARVVAVADDGKLAIMVGESSLAQEYPGGTPPVGVMTTRYYFKLIAPGKTTLRVQVFTRGHRGPVKTVEQTVEIQEAVRYRCG